MKNRINFLDNLRTAMIFLVVVLHAGLVYEEVLKQQWIVIDPVKNHSIGLIRMYLDLFIMFILFFIAGYFTPRSLVSKSAIQFMKSKFRRIMLPWILAVVTLIPIYKIIFLYSRGLPQEEWYSYFHFFQRAGTDWGFFANHPTQSWLWFLPVLFMFQLTYLLLSKMGVLKMRISMEVATILTFSGGLVSSLLLSETGNSGWFHSYLLHFQNERLVIYLMVFLLGTLSYKLNVFQSNNRNRPLYIWANIILAISLTVFTAVALNLFFNLIDPGRNYYFISPTMDKFMYYATFLSSMLSFVYVFIYIFRFYLNKTNRLVEELNRNSYQVYIIHMIVLGGLALLLMNVNIPAMIKFLLLTVLTFATSNLLVTAYRIVIQPRMILKVAGLVILGGVFLLISNNGNSSDKVSSSVETKVASAEDVVPKIGLHEAVLQGSLEIVWQHIDAGSDLDVIEPNGGSSPLITAAVFGKTEVALSLIEAGADVNFVNRDGSTPLHSAAFFCRTEILESLLEHGADINLKNSSGSTAYETASVPFEYVKGYYEYYSKSLGPMGLVLDLEEIESLRPIVAGLLESRLELLQQ